MNPEIFFNAQHSPVGAFASFTLGHPGKSGGLGMELGGPACENLYIGVENPAGGTFEALPFFAGAEDESRRYDVNAESTGSSQHRIIPFAHERILRKFTPCTDTWSVDDFTFTIYSPVRPVPEPGTAKKDAMREALLPAVTAEITVDNRKGKRARRAFFGYQGGDPYSAMHRIEGKKNLTGVAQGLRTGIFSKERGVFAGQGFTAESCLLPEVPENLVFGLGGCGLLMVDVPAGKKQSFRFAICFHRDGIATSGLPCSYFYTRFFPDLESVARCALKLWEKQKELARQCDRKVAGAKLNPARHFQLSQAVRSYLGSTQFLENEGRPFWVVNEGEYRMMNTFDLTVDHLFFEMDWNPWVVRNQLEWFLDRYSYRDRVRLPGDSKEYPGGISFTHDMGIANHVSRPHFSTYELFGLDGCFSHMTHEQLVNWVLCAITYWKLSGDLRWIQKHAGVLADCLESMVARDHPDPALRDGVMSADSSRCKGGAEITTYDSLDVSLGQARNNLYLAVKTWAAYAGIEEVFSLSKKTAKLSRLAGDQAVLCGNTIAGFLREDGFIPAVMGENNESRIIPAIEGLVFPHIWGQCCSKLHPALLEALRMHFDTIMKPGTCLFPEGGWKLSSTNDNSWLSKIYLCQFVAERVLDRKCLRKDDDVHRGWLLDAKNSFFAWSDQMVSGKARGSKYYPRGVTSWLWLRPKQAAK